MKLRLFGKKADLSLSINAIVILILAITMLGLGLGFLRGTFSKTTAQFTQVADDVKLQVMDKIKQSKDNLALDILEVEIKRGESRDVYFGVRNAFDTEENFLLSANCTQMIDGSTPRGVNFDVFSEVSVKGKDIDVSKMIISAASDAKLGTSYCEIDALSSKSLVSTASSDNQTEFTFCYPGCPYAAKKFFVKVI
jgi:hypothetical protein